MCSPQREGKKYIQLVSSTVKPVLSPVHTCNFSGLLRLFCEKMGVAPKCTISRNVNRKSTKMCKKIASVNGPLHRQTTHVKKAFLFAQKVGHTCAEQKEKSNISIIDVSQRRFCPLEQPPHFYDRPFLRAVGIGVFQFSTLKLCSELPTGDFVTDFLRIRQNV